MTLFFLSRSDPPAGAPYEVSGHVTLRDSAGAVGEMGKDSEWTIDVDVGIYGC